MKKHAHLTCSFAILLLALVSNTVTAQSSDLLYDCAFSGVGGDRTTRGFYVENYPSTTLGSVVLGLATGGGQGLHSITIHARENTYDGTLIGSAGRVIDLGSASIEVEFDFGDVSVTPGIIVTFQIVVASDPSSRGYAFYDVGDGTDCTDVTQTNSTTPPLDSFRRNAVGLKLYGLAGTTPPDVNEPPVASFTYACTDLNCTFDGSGSSDSDGTIVQWAWSFGDGMTGDGEKTSHSFTAAGSYVVALTVHDNDGDIDAIDQQVDVTVTPVQPPVVTPAVPVPTMSAWGKLGMVFVLMFAGLGYTRRYKK